MTKPKDTDALFVQISEVSMSGATVWDLYAVAALLGLCACPNVDGGPNRHARLAAQAADALLAEREDRNAHGSRDDIKRDDV